MLRCQIRACLISWSIKSKFSALECVGSCWQNVWHTHLYLRTYSNAPNKCPRFNDKKNYTIGLSIWIWTQKVSTWLNTCNFFFIFEKNTSGGLIMYLGEFDFFNKCLCSKNHKYIIKLPLRKFWLKIFLCLDLHEN